jgi:hypothetical protein
MFEELKKFVSQYKGPDHEIENLDFEFLFDKEMPATISAD